MDDAAVLPALSNPLPAIVSRMARALNCVEEAIVWTDTHGCVQWCNMPFERLVDQTSAAMATQLLAQVLPLTLAGDAVPLALHPVSCGLATNQPQEGQYGFQQHDRHLRLAMTVAPLPCSEDDRATGVMLVIRDVTTQLERQQSEAVLRESERWLRSVFETTAVGMVIASPDDSLLQINAAYCQMVGYTQTELLAKTCRQLVHADDLEDGQEPLKKLLTGELSVYHTERRYFHKKGHVVWGLLSISVMRNVQQQPLYVVYQVQNITERKQAELALQQLNQELEQRVQKRTAQLQQTNQQLQAAIVAHEQTEAALRKSEKRFRTLFALAPIAISLADVHTYQIVEVNQAHHELLGYSNAELATLTHVEITHPADVGKNLEQVRQLLDGTIARFQLEKRFIKKNGDWLWATLTVALIHDPDGRTYSMAMIEDITDRKQAEELLQLTQFSIDRAVDPIWWVEPDGRIYYVNDAACRDLGYTRGDIIGKRVSDFNPNLPIEAWADHWSMIKAKGSLTFEAPVRAKNGTLLLTEVTANYIELNGKEYHCSFVRNITDRKQAEDQLRASLTEKEFLLKEVHHRVKNNLQTVSSLLNLQASAIQDPSVLAPFQDSQRRIKAMALVHERLYQSESLAKVNFSDYVHHLVTDLIHSYSTDLTRIHLKMEIIPLELAVGVAISCGLIINELVTNALKYAFPNDRAGEINLCFSLSPTNQCRLIVADNGVGLTPMASLDRVLTPGSLGLQLVNAFVHQLRGTVELDCSRGTHFELSFPNSA